MPMSTASPASTSVADEDLLRAQLYRLMGSLLAREPTGEVLAVIRGLQGDDSDLGRAFQKLAGQADKFGEESVRREFLDLFIGVGRGELVPYGSYYLTGFLNEKPLAKLRNAMRDLGIERADDVKEPEDNIGSLMEMMAGLIEGDFGTPLSHQEQKAFFDNHVGNWASYFFRDLSAAESSKFYKPVGEIGVLFMEIEKAAFEMAGEQQSTAGDQGGTSAAD